jgi:hypothetical protein
MKHTKNLTVARPAKAESLLETGQKATVASSIIKALGEALGFFGDLRDFFAPEEE